MKYWLPLVAWILLIFLGSGDVLSAQHTSRFVEPFLRWLWPHISSDTLENVHFVLRKAAHMFEYAVLALLFFRAITHTTAIHWRKTILVLTVVIGCVILATADEFRQTFTQTRGPSPWDVTIDAAGAIIAILIYSRLMKRMKRLSGAEE